MVIIEIDANKVEMYNGEKIWFCKNDPIWLKIWI